MYCGSAQGGLKGGVAVGIGEIPVRADHAGQGRTEGMAVRFRLAAKEHVGGGNARKRFAESAVEKGDGLRGGKVGKVGAAVEERIGQNARRGVGPEEDRIEILLLGQQVGPVDVISGVVGGVEKRRCILCRGEGTGGETSREGGIG